ncbi:muscle, skeletal receptor tyrosine-protein kinase-like isoform X2 [Oscarella lobularis]|uniref:muscle, skeletal receptor tyrosine-protein kinase-like isoform X2 n=1 Tax=Oscarella lobularis TaxID=121494 RepID=UPI00331402D4
MCICYENMSRYRLLSHILLACVMIKFSVALTCFDYLMKPVYSRNFYVESLSFNDFCCEGWKQNSSNDSLCSAKTSIFFTLHPKDSVIYAGESVSLNCSVNQTNSSISWWKGNTVFEGILLDKMLQSTAETESGITSVLKLENVTLSDGGYYFCKAQFENDSFPTTSKSARLGVLGKITAWVNSSTSFRELDWGRGFRCFFSANPLPLPQIFGGEKNLKVTVVQSLGNFQWMFTYYSYYSSRDAPLGNYTCFLSYGDSHKSLRRSYLIQKAARLTRLSPSTIHMNAFQPTIARCAAFGVPLPEIRWYRCDFYARNNSNNDWDCLKPSSVLVTSDDIAGSVYYNNTYNISEWKTESILRFEKAEVSAARCYLCLASNTVRGMRHEVSNSVLVAVDPRIEALNDSISATSKSKVILACRVTGSFPAKVTWFYRGIQTGSHRVLASYAEPILYSYLVIESAVAEDNAGVYRCLASVSGFDPLSANISLLIPSRQITWPKSQYVCAGCNLTLSCRNESFPVESNPALWFHNDVPVNNSKITTTAYSSFYKTAAIYTLSAAFISAEDGGNYSCFNQFSAAEIKISPLIVKGPNNISVTEGTDAEFYCLAKESHFKIRRAARQFSGWFRCRTAVEQPHSSDHDYDEVIVHSGPAYLEILYVEQPIFSTQTAHIVLNQGQLFYVRCYAEKSNPSSTLAIVKRSSNSSEDELVLAPAVGSIEISSSDTELGLTFLRASENIAGLYRCRNKNVAGMKYSREIHISLLGTPTASPKDEVDNSSLYISLSVMFGLLLASALLTIFILRERRKRKRRRAQQTARNDIDMQEIAATLENDYTESDRMYTLPTYEDVQFPRSKLQITSQIGEGHFGKVYLAKAEGIRSDKETLLVAVKTIKTGCSKAIAAEFQEEIEIMMNFSHPKIISLLGICSREEPYYIITEYMCHGDLRDFLIKRRPTSYRTSSLSQADLLDIIVQVSSGMAYLASCKFVHRDIAARNCLVGNDQLLVDSFVVKISDFGMARDIYQSDYYSKKGGALPIRWMAPEAISDGRHTVQSDMWSFGVLMWEVMTFGYQPFFGIDNETVLYGKVRGTLQLEEPDECPKKLYALMKRCWRQEPEKRIESQEMQQELNEIRIRLSGVSKKSDDYVPMEAPSFVSFLPPKAISLETRNPTFNIETSSCDDSYVPMKSE